MACPSLNEIKASGSYHVVLPVIGKVLKESLVTDTFGEASSDEEEREVTLFHGHISKDTPSIEKFLYRMCFYGQSSKEVFVMTYIYLRRYQEKTGWALSAENVHRLVLAAFVAAVKVRDDVHYCNKFYSRLGGVALKELNRLEQEFLISLDFDLEVSSKEYSGVVQMLKKRGGQPSPPSVPASSFRRKLSSLSASSYASSSSVPPSPTRRSTVPCGSGVQAARARMSS
eukprot:TRINITY_DN2374_c1_g1_i1.p1 TRINITY_DN2374_c1_g1~~TRINITY_DN2374_c1_g1_i1.p1  ORF type:complete len:242 (+),score=46.00 TRINITY_DN2374_c1_g1_i1:44-727(+)